MTIRGFHQFCAAAFAAVALAFGPAPAFAAERPEPVVLALLLDDNPFTSLVAKRGQRPGASDVERYVTTDGARYFLFETNASAARIKFLCAPSDPRVECALPGDPAEILALTPNRGPRGDLFYKSAEGETVLRIAAHGGAIVAWPGSAETVGAVRTETAPGDSLRLEAGTASGAAQRAEAARLALAAEIGRPISFDTGVHAARSGLARPAAFAAAAEAAPAALDVSDDEASVLADAIARAAAGIERVARDRAGANAVRDRIVAVRFVEAARPALALDGKTLIVSYNPGGGLAGRPSSSEVARFLEGVL